MQNLNLISKQFQLAGAVVQIKPLGAGLINDSYKIETIPGAPDYLLQRINHAIFQDVDGLQKNIERITNHIRTKLIQSGDPEVERKVLRLVYTTDGKSYFKDDQGNYWRIFVFISDSISYEAITPELAGQAGKAFGEFQSFLADLPGEPLVATIPNFHNMETRWASFEEAVKNNKAGRLSGIQDLVNELSARSQEMCKVERLYREGKLIKRVSHCDTKVNNVLFDRHTNKILCVVDLDTTMPGFVLSDVGDFIRTAVNKGMEDDTDLPKIGPNLDIFESFIKGYLSTATFLTTMEKELLVFGGRLLTYMQAVRFLTDYLDGDTYYKIRHKEHNLERSIAQFTYLKRLEENYDTMCKMVNE
jgi:hypothetical protein